MRKVLIIDDSKKYRKSMVNLVKEVDAEAIIYETSDENEAYATAVKKTIDIFIVDIVLHSEKKGGDDSGAEFVYNMRMIERYRFTPVIIVSHLCDPGMNMYDTANCYRFIEKPFDEKTFKTAVADAVRYKTVENNKKHLFFHNNGTLESVFLNDIIYAESSLRMLEVYTGKRKYTIPRKTCEWLIEEFETDDFLRCGKGALVNVNHIKSVDRINRYIKMRGLHESIEIGTATTKNFFEELYGFGKIV